MGVCVMDEKKPKEGISIKEIESFTKKHRFEMFFSLAFLLSCFFSFVFFSGWSVVLMSIGGILGILFPEKIDVILKKVSLFCYKQEDLTQLVLGGAGLILAIFLPPVVFFSLGVFGGRKAKQLSEGPIPQGKE
jgi:hypothetical protein